VLDEKEGWEEVICI